MSSPAAPIVSSRRFAASRERVFEAFRDAARLARWWGPSGSVNELHAFDFRPGGVWRFTMRGRDGAAYEMDHRFLEIDPPSRIVVRHEQAGHSFTLTMALDAEGDGARLTWRMEFDDPSEGDAVRAFVLAANEENFDRLAAVLGEEGAAPRRNYT